MIAATAFILSHQGARFEETQVELDTLQAHEVLVDLVATGICHTDIAVQQGKIPMSFPAVLGHEGSGVVRVVGSDVKGLCVGDHVVMSYSYCGHCQACETYHTYRCDEIREKNFGGRRSDGSSTIRTDHEIISTCFFGQSSLCNPAIVQEASCVKVDKKLPLDVICALGCGFQTGAGCVYNVVKPAERRARHLAIFGLGGVGCAAIMAARQLITSGMSNPFSVVAIDINTDRLLLAAELGATHTINSSSNKTLRSSIMDLTAGKGLDAAIDCSGVVSVVEDMIDLVGPGGIAVTVGGPSPGAKVNVDVFDMLIRCKTYCGCHQGGAYSKEFIPWLTQGYMDGAFPLERMQKKYPVGKINDACQDMQSGKVLKPILIW